MEDNKMISKAEFDAEMHKQDAMHRRLQTSMVSQTDIDALNAQIKKDCSKYFGILGSRPPLFRGMMHKNSSGIAVVRKDRKSSMDQKVADYLNDWLEKQGHMRRDESIMCTSNIDWTDTFGRAYYIFPIGKMEYTWVETKDINIASPADGWDTYTVEAWHAQSIELTKNPRSIEIDKKILEKLKKPFADYFHTNKGFNIAYVKEYEMWINCDKYYYCDAEKYDWNKGEKKLELAEEW